MCDNMFLVHVEMLTIFFLPGIATQSVNTAVLTTLGVSIMKEEQPAIGNNKIIRSKFL